MAETSQAVFQCTGCGKRYRWKPSLAGRTVKCACGAAMTLPQGRPPEQDDLYALAPQPQPPLAALAPTSNAAGPAHTPSPKRILNYQDKTTPVVAVDEYFPDRIKDLYMPLVLLCGSIVVLFIANWWPRSARAGAAKFALALVGIEILIITPMLLVGIFIAAKRRGFNIGRFWAAVLKLSAISVAPSAAMTLLAMWLQFFPFGWLIVWVLVFCFYFALIGAFFDLDQSDTWYCVMIIFLIRLAVAFAVKWSTGR